MNANTVVKITHIIWRNGTPRFVPGPGLRTRGFTGKDLKHASGQWFSFEEAKTFSQQINDQVARLKAIERGDDPDALDNTATPVTAIISITSVGQMIADTFARPEFKGHETIDGRKIRKPLSPATIRDYTTTARIIENDHLDIWAASAASLNKKIITGLLDQIEIKRGLSQARKVRALLSMCYSRSGHEINPVSKVRLPGLTPRLKAAGYDEMIHFIACADSAGRPDIADMLMLGVFTGQRQKDRFLMVPAAPHSGSSSQIILKQSKTGALVDIPFAMPLQTRLDAARDRRHTDKIQHPHACIDEAHKTPWDTEGSHYRKIFSKIRATAAIKYPYLKDFHDQDLRDTAVTWLANAGCTVPLICSVTGHSVTSAGQVLKHYLARSPEQAAEAIRRVVIWFDKQGKDE